MPPRARSATVYGPANALGGAMRTSPEACWLPAEGSTSSIAASTSRSPGLGVGQGPQDGHPGRGTQIEVTAAAARASANEKRSSRSSPSRPSPGRPDGGLTTRAHSTGVESAVQQPLSNQKSLGSARCQAPDQPCWTSGMRGPRPAACCTPAPGPGAARPTGKAPTALTAADGEPDPPVLAEKAEQRLRDRQAHELGLAEAARAAFDPALLQAPPCRRAARIGRHERN